jgi:protein O-GlcNAc transferase
LSEHTNTSAQSTPDEARAAELLQTGLTQYSRREYVAAMAAFRGALEFRPDWCEGRHELGRALYNLGQIEEALDLFRQNAVSNDPAKSEAAIALIIPGSPRGDNQAILDARRTWSRRHFPAAASQATRPTQSPEPSRRLRVGYVSAFFKDPNWMKPVWGLINHHDRARFEVYLFSDAPALQAQGYQICLQDHFYDTSALSNDVLYRGIRDLHLDLLIDLNGYSATPRLGLFAMRPAPVIAGWFNMYATSGIDAYDYLIGDDVVIPPQEEKFYSEKILRVPGSYLTFEICYPVPPVAEPPCLRNGAVTFGSMASQYKIHEELVGAWSSILRQVPSSSLLLKNRALASAATRDFVHGLFARYEIPSSRVRLEGPADHHEFLKTYDEIDIALDSFPYNGGTTTTEALWQGAPVVAYRGDRWVARTSASLLCAGGLGDLVAKDVEGYIALAVRLANSPERLSALRRDMRSRLQASEVCDTETFARNMESLYLQMVNGAD